MTRDEKKAEAIKRMKLADIFPQTIKQFEEDGYNCWCSWPELGEALSKMRMRRCG